MVRAIFMGFRRAIILAALAALLAVGSASARSVCTGSCYVAPAGSGALFVFTGHGWGHGVGMSQYGAYGYAQHGWTYPKILAHYYPGTKLGRTATTSIRVLLADRQKTVKISSTVPFTVTDGSGARHTLAAGAFSFGTALQLPVDGGALQPLTAPLTFSPGAGGSLTLGRAYRGRILVDVVDGKLRAINIVPLEQYLYGVVPAEMPSSWLPDALAAQAIASRSYALATRQLAAPFDVYSDTRSQMYLGIGAEQPSTTAAVTATAGQVLLYKGAVATTVFFSTSGGETSSSADAWGGKPTPYLVSVPDPYDVISPFHDWGPVPVTALTLAKALHVVGTVADVTTTLNLSGRVSQLDLTTLTPSSTFPLLSTVGANTVQGALGLRSTWFDVGVLSLSPPIPSLPVPYGSTVQLSGVVRGVDGVSLEQRPSSATWQPVGPVVTQTDGTVQLTGDPDDHDGLPAGDDADRRGIRADQGDAGGHAGGPGGADDAAGHDHARARRSSRPDPAARPERSHVDDGRNGNGRPDRHLDDRSHRNVHRAAAAHRRDVPRRHRPRARLFARDLGAAHRERLMKRALLVALTAALVAAAPAAAFTPADPLAADQWYLGAGSRVRRVADSTAHARAGEGGGRSTPASTTRFPTSRARSPTGGASSAAARSSTPRGTAPSSPARSRRSSTRPASPAWRTRRSCSWRRW